MKCPRIHSTLGFTFLLAWLITLGVLLVTLCVTVSPTSFQPVAVVSLFHDTPEVLELSGFPSIESHSPSVGALPRCPWYVLFYAPWCAHCRREAHTYKQLAVNISRQGDNPTHIAAVDCSLYGRHFAEATIEAYPTLYYGGRESWREVDLPDGDLSRVFSVGSAGGEPNTEASRAPLLWEQNHTATRVCVASRNEAVDRRRQLPRTNAVFVPRVGWYNYYQSFYAALQEEVDPHTRELASKLPKEHCDSDTEVGSPVCVYMKFRAAALAGVPELQYTLAPDPLTDCGYTCGLWLLFHRMIQAPEALETLDAIRSYVLTFFRCTACRDHFRKIPYTPNRSSGAREDEARLWLWRSHNAVNLRLGKAHFPSPSQCPECVDENTTLDFLSTYYGPMPNTPKKRWFGFFPW